MSDFDLLKDIVVTVEYAQREWDNYTQVIHINNAMLLINKLAELEAEVHAEHQQYQELSDQAVRLSKRIHELEAANAKMRKCLEAIAEHHNKEWEQLSVIQQWHYHTERRDFALEGLK